MPKRKRVGSCLAFVFFSSIAWGSSTVATPNGASDDQVTSPPNPAYSSNCPTCLGLPPVSNTTPLTVDPWHFLVAPYLWGSSINGHVTIDNHTVDTNIPFSQIFDDLKFGGQIHLEAGYGPWTAMVDPTYLNLEQNIAVGPYTADFRSQLALVDMGMYYQLWSLPATQASSQSVSLEAFGGARYFFLDNTISLPPYGSFDNNTNTISPIVGGRVKYDCTSKLHFWVRGDIGGFHIDGMNSTWSTTAGVSYTVIRFMDLGLAYKVLQLDYARPSFAMNTLLYGPMIGIGFHW